jgi:hypothetical protein
MTLSPGRLCHEAPALPVIRGASNLTDLVAIIPLRGSVLSANLQIHLNNLPPHPITHRPQACAVWVPQDA